MLWFLVFRYGGGFLAALFVEEEPLYQEFAVHCFRLYMLGFFVYGLPNVTASFFQAIGSPVKSLAVSLSRQVIFLIPFALLLSAHFGMMVHWGRHLLRMYWRFLLAALLLKRELRGWKKEKYDSIKASEASDVFFLRRFIFIKHTKKRMILR